MRPGGNGTAAAAPGREETPIEAAKRGGNDTLVDLAYRCIRRDIIEEVLPAGEKINLSLLCQRYGVSPTPIKQALNRLMMERLVEGIPRKGYRVRRVHWRGIDELFELRLMMELYFAPQAAQAVSCSTLLQKKMEENLRENLRLVKIFASPEEYFQTYELDRQFHELYMTASGSQAAVQMYRQLNTHTYAAYLFGKQPRDKTVEGIQEHEDMYRAMQAGDADELCRQVRRHNENARAKIQMVLKLHDLI